MAESTISQGDFNCRASSQADFILNNFFPLKFPNKCSISSQPRCSLEQLK